MKGIILSLLLVLLPCAILCQQVNYYQTAYNTTDRLTEKAPISFTPFQTTPINRITINRNEIYQTIHGFGGAFTDAASITFASLNENLQEEILNLYWGEDGIGYSTGRIHMNSCDFSLYSYNFDNVINDVDLIYFDDNVTHDTITMIPFLQRANQTFINAQSSKLIKEKNNKKGEEANMNNMDNNNNNNNMNNNNINKNSGYPSEGLQVFLSPWSPPGWMKVAVNGKQSMDGSATPQGLMEEYYYSWSLYFIKFIRAYMNKNITFWGLTIQNEPEYAAPYEACVYTPESELELVVNYLGPMMRSEFPWMKILAYDHNRDDVYTWAETIYSTNDSLSYFDGMAFHWYVSQQFQNVNATYYLEPNKILLATEACNCPMSATYNQTNDVYDWMRGESYGQDIIGDLNNFAQGWTDWNLLLNTQGGPNHEQNYCDSPIVADADLQQIYIQTTYYYMGHISKFIPPGSQRIYSYANVTFQDEPVPSIPSSSSTPSTSTSPISSSSTSPTSSPSSSKVVNNVFLFSGMNIILWDWQNSPQQKFTFEKNAFFVKGTNFCFNIENSSNDNGANVQLYDFLPNSANELWNLNPITNGSSTFTITSQLNGKCLDLTDFSTTNGANIQLWECTGGINQQWIFDSESGSITSAMDPSKSITAGWSPLLNVAFVNPAGTGVVVVVMNPTDQSISFDIYDPLVSTSSSIQTSIPPHAIQTYLYPI